MRSKKAFKNKKPGAGKKNNPKTTSVSEVQKRANEDFIFRYLETPITIFDHRTRRFIYANKALCDLLGCDLEELNHPENGFLSRVHAEDMKLWQEKINPQLEQISKLYINRQVTFNTIFRYINKQGAYITILLHTRVLEWEGDKRTVILSTYTKITDFKKDAGKYIEIKVLNEKDDTWEIIHKETFHFKPPMLTSQEAILMKLMTEGLSANEIAKKIHLSYYTVRAHWRNILAKTECKNNRELTELATKEGWI